MLISSWNLAETLAAVLQSCACVWKALTMNFAPLIVCEIRGLFGSMTRATWVSSDNFALQNKHLMLFSKESNLVYEGQMSSFIHWLASVIWGSWQLPIKKTELSQPTSPCTLGRMGSTRVTQLGYHFHWFLAFGSNVHIIRVLWQHCWICPRCLMWYWKSLGCFAGELHLLTLQMNYIS